MAKKLAFLVADGMGGWPLEALGGKTTLEAATTPNMDRLAGQGVIGLCHSVPPGMPPGSDVANMSLLGFNPAEHHTGRGPIEAAAQGLELGPEDLVWRCNLLSVSKYSDSGNMLDYSAGHIKSEISRPIIESLGEKLNNAEFRLIPGVQYRHLLVQPGAAKAVEAGLTVRPPHDITGQPITPDLETLAKAPKLLDFLRQAAKLLAGAQANALWPWGQGRALTLPNFRQSFGLSGAVISAVDLIRGLGRAAGLEVIDVPGATGLLDTNYAGKAEAAIEFLSRGDFVFVHLEGPDECGHGGDAKCKVEAISRFDELIVGPIARAMQDQDCAIVCTCDHLTPVAKRTHVSDPVPFLLQAPGLTGSGAPEFSEKSAAASGLSIKDGHNLLPFILKSINMGAKSR